MSSPGRDPATGHATGHAGGKLILCGEHAVVHGQPALAFGVDLGTTVTLAPGAGGPRAAVDLGDPRVDAALRAVLGDRDVVVHVDTALPVGRGMGSSASLAVALVRARDAWEGLAPRDAAAVVADAMPVERVFHGNPSGLDVEVCARGGVLRFRREPVERRALPCPAWQVVVLDTGVRGDTGALVAHVTSQRPGIDPILDRIGQLVDAAEAVLHDATALGPLLDENQALLAQVGVSTPDVDALCRLARDAGAHGAKLSGAGGGGVVLALVDDPAPVLAAAQAAGVPAWPCRPLSPEAP